MHTKHNNLKRPYSQSINLTVNITKIVLMLSSLWTANNALLVYYIWYTSFSMFLYIFKILRTANHANFCLFYFDFVSYKLAVTLIFESFCPFISCDREFPTLRSTMELQIPNGFLKESVLKVSETISKWQHRRFQSKLRCYWKFKVVVFLLFDIWEPQEKNESLMYIYIYIHIYI